MRDAGDEPGLESSQLHFLRQAPGSEPDGERYGGGDEPQEGEIQRKVPARRSFDLAGVELTRLELPSGDESGHSDRGKRWGFSVRREAGDEESLGIDEREQGLAAGVGFGD